MSREFTALFLSEQTPPSTVPITIEGPTVGYQTQNLSYVITNFDSYSDYGISGPFVNVQQNAEVFTLAVARNAPTGSVEFTVSKNDKIRTLNFTVEEAYVVLPTIVNFDTAVINDVRPTLTATGFSTNPINIDTHVSTDWEIATDITFQNLVWTKAVTTGDLNTTSVDVDLPTDTPLFLRTRFRGAILGAGRWSLIKVFEVVGVAKPTAIVSGAIISGTRISRTFGITSSSYDGPGTHAASRWRVLDTQGVVVHDSGEVIGSRLLAYTPINEGFTPLPNVDYYVDVRYKSSTGIWSRVSDVVSALVADGRVTTYNTNFERQTSVPVTSFPVVCRDPAVIQYYNCFYDDGLDDSFSATCDPNNPYSTLQEPISGSTTTPRTIIDGRYWRVDHLGNPWLIYNYSYAVAMPRVCQTEPSISYTNRLTSVSTQTSRYTEF